MTALRVYIHSTCSTCRKAVAWLREHGHEAELIPIVASPPSRMLLQEAFLQLGSRQRLFNTSGQSYRALGASRIRAMSDQEALDLLAADGKLIRRPFLITAEGRITTGFRPEDWQDLLAGSPPG